MKTCRVYWGTHGCRLERGHAGPHLCDCADNPPEPGVLNVGAPPYYGPETEFYGEDAPPAAKRWAVWEDHISPDDPDYDDGTDAVLGDG